MRLGAPFPTRADGNRSRAEASLAFPGARVDVALVAVAALAELQDPVVALAAVPGSGARLFSTRPCGRVPARLAVVRFFLAG